MSLKKKCERREIKFLRKRKEFGGNCLRHHCFSKNWVAEYSLKLSGISGYVASLVVCCPKKKGISWLLVSISNLVGELVNCSVNCYNFY